MANIPLKNLEYLVLQIGTIDVHNFLLVNIAKYGLFTLHEFKKSRI
jgi:hypothetical protein